MQVEVAVARAMEPFINQLLALGKDVRKLKSEASEDEESSSESSEEEPLSARKPQRLLPHPLRVVRRVTRKPSRCPIPSRWIYHKSMTTSFNVK